MEKWIELAYIDGTVSVHDLVEEAILQYKENDNEVQEIWCITMDKDGETTEEEISFSTLETWANETV